MQTVATVLPYAQIGLSIFLIVLVLMQRSDADLGSAFGADGGGTRFTRRGLEKGLFNATILVAAVFAVLSVLSIIV
ncbi:MAG TPA: preprotein translocase subunit SecG [Candidatus Paceibacterota bacterium]|jgi:preprotein translocase subunit SecG|nr:preprotein translocase subunit SecG [Candidatus Paceibacterota bacterium]